MPERFLLDVPEAYQAFRNAWAQERDKLVDAYALGRVSFLPNLLPELAVRMPVAEALRILRARLGRRVDLALECAATAPPWPNAMAGEASLPEELRSPVAGRPDGSWLKATNTVGINVRTVGSFWSVVQYALTLPAAFDSIHLLPIWEPGVVASLYGMSSWQINPEFFSAELAVACPALDTVERQLAFMVHLLHAMGRTVGMDVIPHTDRFSQIVLSHPSYFEWLRREGERIADHSADLHRLAEGAILAFLAEHGPAVPGIAFPSSAPAFFGALSEEQRLRVLFGEPRDRAGRERRRLLLVRHLNGLGLEPVPATMAPPYRGIEVDPRTRIVDSDGNIWYDYYITRPEPMSRVFGPLARYKLYESLEDNADWALDFSRPRWEVWRYVCGHYAAVQQRYGFDFMRGDMSHVQMRPEGVPAVAGDAYDLLRAVKRTVRVEHGVSHFGYFAESFLAPRDVMGYGDEVDHLEASEADTTLGDLQSTVVGSPEFLQRLRRYHDLAAARRTVPSFTTITGDKDDPRFDGFYLAGNALRLFLALFLGDMPSYTALGFETRDPHPYPAPNEHYTKLYVFHEVDGPKATRGPYVWGRNAALFAQVTRLRLLAEQAVPLVRGRATRWLIAPDATAHHRHLAWTQAGARPGYLFVANTDTAAGVGPFDVPLPPGLSGQEVLELELSTQDPAAAAEPLAFSGRAYRVPGLAPAEGRAYRIRYAGADVAQGAGEASQETGR